MKATKTKQTEQKEIGRFALSDDQDLVATLVDDEKLDLRVFMKTEKYTGPTKRGIRFYIHDQNFEEFKKLLKKVDKVYEQL